jgi:hypothetical protein
MGEIVQTKYTVECVNQIAIDHKTQHFICFKNTWLRSVMSAHTI